MPLGRRGLEPGQKRTPRVPIDRPSSPSPAIPSAPQAVISSVNETSLMLEWTPPRDSGGREDLVYNIICKSCGSGRGACTRCGDNVQYAPRQLGLTEPRIYISDLLAHTQYTFEIQAVNGVTDQSPFSPQFASVNITTNQAGKRFQDRLCQLGVPPAFVKDALPPAVSSPQRLCVCEPATWETLLCGDVCSHCCHWLNVH